MCAVQQWQMASAVVHPMLATDAVPCSPLQSLAHLPPTLTHLFLQAAGARS